MARFYGVLAAWLLAGCAGYAALVLYSASWPEAAALKLILGWELRAFTETEYRALRTGLAALAIAALGGGLLGRATLAGLGREASRVVRQLAATWCQLPAGQRRLAAGLLLALTLLRLYYSLTLQAFDDATSSELFVSQRLLVVSAGYPVPNNHILSNTLNWLFYQVYPGFWWSMRLPMLLVSTLATALWFLALLRRSSFRVALLAVGWFGFTLEGLYLAAVGRGYWLLVGLGAVGFFSLLQLLERPADGPGRRLAAGALVVSSVLGLYTVPTHLLLVAPLYGWWALQVLRGRAGWVGLAEVGASAALTTLGTALLYWPLLLVSGPALLFQHRYMAPLPWPVFWRWVADILTMRYQLLTVPVAAAGLLALLVLVRRAATGQLAAALAGPVLALGPVSAWLVLVPYLLAVPPRSIPPERTLLYKALYLFIVLALVADWWWRRAARPAWVRAGLVAGSVLFAAGQVVRVEWQERIWLVNFDQPSAEPCARWLSAQPAAPVLAAGWRTRFLVRYYGATDFRHQPWRLDALPQPGVRYRYLVVASDEEPMYRGRLLPGPPAIRCPAFAIFVLPPAARQ